MEKSQLFEIAKAADQMLGMVPASDPFRSVYAGLAAFDKPAPVLELMKAGERNMERANILAAYYRRNPRAQRANMAEIAKSGAVMKAEMDVGTLTDFANITGGQSLGYVSLDTQMARGTVRPASFTLYQCLHKTHAFQVVDYWAYASDTGGGLPGTAFTSFSSVGTGTLATSAGKYELQNIFLKLAVNGRAMTTALAAQNSFVDIANSENANAALTVLESFNWTSYWGDSALYPSQPLGIMPTLLSKVPGNIVDYQTFKASYATAQGWSDSQTLFNLIYQWAGQITSYNQFGRITHAFMSPQVVASMNSLVTGILNNLANPQFNGPQGIVVNGDLQGMRTRFGQIDFPMDIFINVRDRAAQAITMEDGSSFAVAANPNPPASVAVAAVSVTGNNDWTSAYTATGQFYTYAVASCDASMTESTLTWATPVSGIAASGGAYRVTVNGPAAANATAFRIYRSGLGYDASSNQNPAAVRYIGTVAASGSGAVTFTDMNLHIPGSETIFLLDMDERDMAIDFRYLLPLTKIELFAQNLYMPWAVAAIGAIRLKVAKFHGAITNFVPENADFNPLAANADAV